MPTSPSAILPRICAESWGELLTAVEFEVAPVKDRHASVAVEYQRHTGTRIQKVDVQRDKYWTNQKG